MSLRVLGRMRDGWRGGGEGLLQFSLKLPSREKVCSVQEGSSHLCPVLDRHLSALSGPKEMSDTSRCVPPRCNCFNLGVPTPTP